jgi:hypothetical protein
MNGRLNSEAGGRKTLRTVDFRAERLRPAEELQTLRCANRRGWLEFCGVKVLKLSVSLL